MKTIFLAALVAMLTTLASGQVVANRLEGCVDPQLLATGVGRLSDKNWNDVSSKDLVSSWPTHLESGCGDGPSPATIVGRDRVILGQIECGEVFDFDVVHTDGNETGHLRTITLHYTVSNKQEGASIAKLLAKAFGVSSSEIASIGSEDQQQFQRQDKATNVLVVVDLRLKQIGTKWSLFVATSHFPLDKGLR